MRRRASHVVLGVTAACAARAVAQSPEAETGPIVVGERRTAWRWFEPVRLTMAIDFLGSDRRETIEQSGQPTLTNRERIAREALEISGQAYIGHKNLIDLTGRLRLQLEEHWLRSGSLNSNDNTNELDALYDLNARVLGATSFPFDVYARRDSQSLNRDFGTALRQTTTEFGIIESLQSSKYPTTIQLSHTDSDQHDLLGQFGYTFKKDTLQVHSHLVFSDRHALDAAYILDSVHEDQRGVYSTSYIRHDLSLTDSYTFGKRKQNELRSYFKFYDQGGLFEQRTLRLDEQLRLTHSDTLESRYVLGMEQRSRGVSDQSTLRADASLRHKLFESLVSTAHLGAQRLDSNGFVSTELFGGGTADYTKRIKHGRLELSLAAEYNNQDNGARGSTFGVFAETHTYTGGVSIVVPRRNVVSGSLRVAAPGGAPVYVEGVDYTVNYFPDRIEIVPIPGQGIAAGADVSLDYDIGPEPANSIETLSTAAAARYTFTESNFKGLSLYGSYRVVDHSVSAVDPSVITIDDTTETQLGVEYRRNGWTFRAEKDDRRSTLNPYDTRRLQVLYDRRLGPASLLSVEATNELINYKNPANQIDFTRASVRWLEQLGPTLDLESRVIYRNEKNQTAGDSDGIDAKVGLRWHYRQTSAYVTVGNTVFGTPASNTTSNLVEIGLRREF